MSDTAAILLQDYDAWQKRVTAFLLANLDNYRDPAVHLRFRASSINDVSVGITFKRNTGIPFELFHKAMPVVSGSWSNGGMTLFGTMHSVMTNLMYVFPTLDVFTALQREVEANPWPDQDKMLRLLDPIAWAAHNE